MKRIKLEQQHYQWGLTAFLVVVCSVLAFFAIYRFDIIQRFFGFAAGVLAPFIYGLVMAYLLCPVYNTTVRGTYRLLSRGSWSFKHDLPVAKAIGTVISVAVIIVVLVGVFWMIIPGLVNSVVNVVDILPSATRQMTLWLDHQVENIPLIRDNIDDWMSVLSQKAMEFATNTLLPHSQSVAAAVSQGVIGAAGFVMDFIIGIIICVYFLNSKDTFLAQIKKFIIANFKESTAEEIFHGATFTNRSFGGFINGKIIDSLIIGIICFLVMTIFGWEYSLLISCIVGITNIIPFFGPFIGAIPSAFLLLMVSPMHALYFVIFVLVLQQFDGNILGPKILGDSTGLASFWVLFAVLVGGGLFGFIGMVIGIPVFAVIYYYAGRALNSKLARKGYSTDLEDYRIDPYRSAKAEEERSNNPIAVFFRRRRARSVKEEQADDAETASQDSARPKAGADPAEDPSEEKDER